MSRKLLAGLAMIALLGGFSVLTATTIQAHTQPSAAEQAATDLGVAIQWRDGITCDGIEAVGCYSGGRKIVIQSGMDAEFTEFVIYHELAHFMSRQDDLGWSEADADAYADRMTD